MLAALVMTMMTKTMMTMSKKSIVVSPPDKPPLGLSISCSSTTMFFLPNDPPDPHDHHACCQSPPCQLQCLSAMLILILKINTKITMLAFLCQAITVFLFPDNHHDLMRSTISLFFLMLSLIYWLFAKKIWITLMTMTMKIIEYSVLGKGDNMYDGIIWLAHPKAEPLGEL